MNNQQFKQPQDQDRAREKAGTGQAKDWEHNQNSGQPDMGDEADADLGETSVNPSLENRAFQDDELENEMTKEEGDDFDIGDDSDLDYRDGHDRGSEDQDDSDELREGK